MFCSRCGQAFQVGQSYCPQCGSASVPAVPGYQFLLEGHANKLRSLAVCWLVYAALAFITGILSIRFAQFFLMGPLAPWTHATRPPFLPMPMLMHFAWMSIVVRTVLALAAGWGLWERAGWGRIVAILSAFVNLVKFPFGTALGIWTLVVLMGGRNATLYDQSPQA